MKHLCEELADSQSQQKFRVMYWDENWCELVHLRVECCRPEIAYSAVGTWVLVLSCYSNIPDTVLRQLLDAKSVTVEVSDG